MITEILYKCSHTACPRFDQVQRAVISDGTSEDVERFLRGRCQRCGSESLQNATNLDEQTRETLPDVQARKK
jgi:hypothetical protein